MDSSVSFAAGIKATRTKYGLGLPYTAYVIQVRVEQDQNFTSWNVSRRFNAFYELNQKLQTRHPSLKNYPFPRKNRMTRYDHNVIEMRCKELGNYLTKCLDSPAVTDDPDFRTFLGFPASLMNLKARAYSIMPDNIHHGEAEGDEVGAESSDDETAAAIPPPKLVAPSSSTSPPPVPSRTHVSSPSSPDNSTATPPVPAASNSSTPKPPTDDDAVAMFDYAGTDDGELAFKVGEIIHVIESQAPPDWAAGYTDTSTADKPGYFPRSFVRPLTSEDYIWNSKTETWSLRDDILDFNFDPNTKTYSYGKPPRAPASSLYK